MLVIQGNCQVSMNDYAIIFFWDLTNGLCRSALNQNLEQTADWNWKGHRKVFDGSRL